MQKKFDLEHAFAETHVRLKNFNPEKRMMMRVIDHAWSSEACISQRVFDMMRSLSPDVTSDFSGEQQLDACGYIAADAACALRDAALAKCNSWLNIPLADYTSLDCVKRGNEILHKPENDRILYPEDINLLVRRYTGIDQRHQVITLSHDRLFCGNPEVGCCRSHDNMTTAAQ